MKFLLLLVTLPLLLAIGYDVHVNIQESETDFRMVATGFVLKQESPGTLRYLNQTLEPQQFKLLSQYVLSQKTVLVTGVFAGFFYILAFFLRLMGVIGGSRRSYEPLERKKRKIDALLGEKSDKKFKYTRK